MIKIRVRGRTVGFVPTMGALHEGHLSLVKQALKENDIVVVSIFVNPTQFGPKEDFKKYPRPQAQDRHLLEKEKVDYLFSPTAYDMYPPGSRTAVEVGEISNILCGKFRPGHFRGVATVVAKLFNLSGPCRAYFGQKDFQQSVIIRRLVQDLDFPVTIRVMPTVRETGGLAMSSRNQYLSSEERTKALAISQTLFWMQDQITRGVRDLKRLHRQGVEKLKRSVDRIDYLEIVDPETLASLKRFQPALVIAAACYVGKTRLIDNVIMRPSQK